MAPTTDLDRHPGGVEDLTEMFEAHVDSVFTVAHRILWNRSDAEDVVQTTFVRVALRSDQLRDRARVRPWLLQIAYRESIGVLRRRRDVPTDPEMLPVLPSLERSPEELVVSREMTAMLVAGLVRMTETERVAVVLRDIEGIPMKDVATVLGVGVSAAKMRVHRGRESLRRLLAAEVIDAL